MISKSSYVKFYKCDKSLWLHLNKPDEESKLDEMAIRRIEDGNLVGDLAKTFFDGTVDISSKSKSGEIDYKVQIEKTKKALEKNVNAIAEASFSIDELFCAVDILKKDDDGYSIYEVKSSLKVQDKHLVDVSFQKYVLEQCGLKINHIYIMHPNEEYKLHKAFDIKKYFKIECVDNEELVIENYKNIKNNIGSIKNILKLKDEPETSFDKKCSDCSFKDYCTKDLPEDRIGILSGIASKAFDFYKKNIFTIKDYVKTKEYQKSTKNNRREVQIKSILNNTTDPTIDKSKIREFLNSLKYPIYYLDFETSSEIIPTIDGFGPSEQFPYQYSLHIEDSKGNIKHKEYLADKGDCIKEIAERLIDDIKPGSTILAFHDSTEKNLIKNLAKWHPNLSDKLLALTENFVDLLDPFKKGYYYDPKQGGSNSIKQVLPALCPNMKDAYKNLNTIHNGAQALTFFSKMIDLKDENKEEYEKLRRSMLEYCKLDTLSMVEIIKVLRNSVK